MKNIGFAFAAIISWVAVNLLLRGAKDVWPINLAGTLSRVITLVLLLTWVLSTGNGWRSLIPGRAAKWLLVMGGVAVGINLLWFNAMDWTSATNVALLFRLDLLFVVVIGSLLGVERIGRVQLLLIGLMFVGLALVTEVHHFDPGGHLVGDVMVVGAALGYAVNAFVIRHILGSMQEEAVAVYNFSFSAVGFAVLAYLNHNFAALPRISASPTAWLWIAALGIAAAVSLPLYYTALRRMPVWKLRTLMLSAPVFVALVEWPLWGIQFTLVQVAGAITILIGLAMLIRVEANQPACSGDADRSAMVS